MKNGKATLGFCIYKIWQILKRFTGTFRQAQTLNLGGVVRITYYTKGWPKNDTFYVRAVSYFLQY